MFKIFLALATGAGAAILLILNQNKKLKSQKKLHDIEIEDAKLEIKQQKVKESKKELDKYLEEIDSKVVKDLTDVEIENFWNKDKK